VAVLLAVASALAACGGGGDDSPEADEAAIAYVALGDSFSSGEGAPPYAPGGGACNVSELAWPRRLYADVAGFVSLDSRACAGARTEHLTGPWEKRSQPPQIPSAPDERITLVTLTIGGNDLGFGDIVGTCVLARCAAPDEESLAALTEELTTSVYPALHAAFPKARIVHVGYPRLTPAPGKPVEGCDWLDEEDQVRAAAILTALDDAIEQAADRSDGAVEFLDMTEAFAGHELCTPTSWLNPVGLGTGHAHPNAAGQRGIEEAVAAGLGLEL
jgi:lysophospholipase L1-like esterase